MTIRKGFRGAAVACLLAGTLLVTACASAAAIDTPNGGVFGGRTRQWLVHVPPQYRHGKTVPLVIAFHGHGGSPSGMARMTGLDAVADKMGFMVVYPQGVDRSWAAGVNAPADRAGVDDVTFAGRLLDRLERKYRIDPARIVLTGFSNGAHLVQLLGCRMAERIDAIVPVSGTLATSLQSGCRPARTLTVVAFHGTEDPIDPYSGGFIRLPGGGAVLPVATMLADWAQWDGCPSQPRTTHGPANGAVHLDRVAWAGCREGVHVTLYRIVGGGHTWPGGPQYLPRFLIGRATRVISASQVIGAIATGRRR